MTNTVSYSWQKLLGLGQAAMAPTISGTSVRNKLSGTSHPGMAKGKEGPPSRTQTSYLLYVFSVATILYNHKISLPELWCGFVKKQRPLVLSRVMHWENLA